MVGCASFPYTLLDIISVHSFRKRLSEIQFLPTAVVKSDTKTHCSVQRTNPRMQLSRFQEKISISHWLLLSEGQISCQSYPQIMFVFIMYIIKTIKIYNKLSIDQFRRKQAAPIVGFGCSFKFVVEDVTELSQNKRY